MSNNMFTVTTIIKMISFLVFEIYGIQQFFTQKRGGSNNQWICSKIRAIITQLHKHTIYIIGYYNQASPQTVEGQLTFSNPRSSSAETVEGQYMFGDPCSSSAVTVGVYQILGNDCSSLVDVRKRLQYARKHSVTLAVAPQRLSNTSRSSVRGGYSRANSWNNL